MKRKQAKENKANGIRKRGTLRDPGVPESWPFREHFLKEMAFEKNRILQDKKSKQAKPKESVMEDMITGAAKQQKQLPTDTSPDPLVPHGGTKEYFKDFRKVVALADVVVQVLDARDPLGCRSRELEDFVREASPPKRLVFLLNKIDLVPRGILESWLKYLRLHAPTIAFKSSTQKQNRNLGQAKHMESCGSRCLGADHLIQLLKNYTRNAGIKTAITVGLVGVPNVGKSSVINSLKRSRSAHVGNKPGVTTHVQEFHLDKQILLLDSPGVIHEKKQSVMQGVMRIEQLSDPVGFVEEITKKLDPVKLCSVYQISDFTSVQEFLQMLANKTGKLKKGGIADVETVSKMVIQDWNNGKIPYYTTPPVQTAATDVQIVDQWAQEFSIDDIYQQDGQVLDSLNEENSESLDQEQMVPEPITGGFEAFSKMAEIRETKAIVKETTEALSQMQFSSLTDPISDSNEVEPSLSNTTVQLTPKNPQVKGLF
eukprot:g2070.t1